MSDGVVDTLVKIGGGLLAHPVHFEATAKTVAAAAATQRILVVPGGGPFADAVRFADRQLKLDATTAHWMAVLAMDQYAHLLSSRLRAAELAADLVGIRAVLIRGRLPVLAPSRWLRERDPLPHSWDVTSDSIAAWIAGTVGASRLVLVKPPGAPADAVDPYFRRALPENIRPPDIVPADQIEMLRRALTV
jgi:aspartokinase-like uncharacterized kinase